MPSMKYFLATIDGKRMLIDYAKDIPKGVTATEIEIQTDKVGLHTAIQELLSEADEAKAKVAPIKSDKPAETAPETPVEPSEQEEEDDARPLLLSRGIDPNRPSWTIQQLNAMFTSRPEHLQDICYSISKLKPHELAYVAFQVIGQMTKPITINITEGG